jgi:hypothetical protein
MSVASETAIARFLGSGGQISRVRECVSIGEAELLAYLAAQGIVAKHVGGERRAYICGNRRMSSSALIALANEHRASDAQPPFALELTPAPSRGRTKSHLGAE